jgi:hypothetical protein
MQLVRRFAITALLAGTCLGLSATAVHAAPANWGQEVKTCNQTDCYPGGTNRGTYVSGQAGDSQGPGYAWEIHTLAGPGKSNPAPFN